ncbi:TetR/AcrR family transcriptional regulator [Amycolatopsis australiensis]|uniref:DNA-binding transcriptional regulator, AcrR family n=1 Tax=Amycolatopsis australiensis TaxID=546364 RepID=A0A1K1SY63_9PSEU|nr:TetR/AcrR family transcriptional regulator [Amycolatopsis australiensis]SFW89274.1 DNA-binding transcriptional regulator, AcrR family [Amycolatopsis australiensis]
MGKGAGVGRPRASGAAANRPDARQAVLDAAGELFTGAGYAATTTRAIAERAGLRQASLYYHFPAKEDILAALLAETVRPSLALAARLVAGSAPVEVRLWALAYADIGLLGGARHNLGALYLLPEVGSPNLARFRAERADLKAAYGKLVAAAGIAPEAVATRTDLVFGLVESIAVTRRDNPSLDVEAHIREGADGVVRLVGLAEPTEELRAAAHTLLATLPD